METSFRTLFEYLRRSGVPIGVGDYLLTLELLRSGYGVDSPERIKSTCRLLWTKSLEDLELFDNAFDRFFAAELVFNEGIYLSENLSSGTEVEQLDQLADSNPTAFDIEPTEENAGRQTALEPIPSLPLDEPDDEFDNSTSETREEISSDVYRDRFSSKSKPKEYNRQEAILPFSSGQKERLLSEVTPPAGIFQMTQRLPISKRSVAGIWKHFREMKQDGPLIDFDVEGTISQICEHGFLLYPVMKARRKNQSSLVLLMDRSPAMYPFQLILDTLIDGIESGGYSGQFHLFYFDELPHGLLSPLPNLSQSMQTNEVIKGFSEDTAFLIVGHADSGTRIYRKALIKNVQQLTSSLSLFTNRVAWLNPMPRSYWKGTSASDIAQELPMFSLDREGLIDCVSVLRGLPTHLELMPYD